MMMMIIMMRIVMITMMIRDRIRQLRPAPSCPPDTPHSIRGWPDCLDPHQPRHGAAVILPSCWRLHIRWIVLYPECWQHGQRSSGHSGTRDTPPPRGCVVLLCFDRLRQSQEFATQCPADPVELEANLPKVWSSTITEKVPSRTFHIWDTMITNPPVP